MRVVDRGADETGPQSDADRSASSRGPAASARNWSFVDPSTWTRATSVNPAFQKGRTPSVIASRSGPHGIEEATSSWRTNCEAAAKLAVVGSSLLTAQPLPNQRNWWCARRTAASASSGSQLIGIWPMARVPPDPTLGASGTPFHSDRVSHEVGRARLFGHQGVSECNHAEAVPGAAASDPLDRLLAGSEVVAKAQGLTPGESGHRDAHSVELPCGDRGVGGDPGVVLPVGRLPPTT